MKKSIVVGRQRWMVGNLDVEHFRNGDPIPEATSDEIWMWACGYGLPVWCYYNYDSDNGIKYGKLYNWFAVVDSRGIAPAGWAVPQLHEWAELKDALELKWKEDRYVTKNEGGQFDDSGNNPSGLKVYWGGQRKTRNGQFEGIEKSCHYWTSSEMCDGFGYNVYGSPNEEFAWGGVTDFPDWAQGAAVRCVYRRSSIVSGDKWL
jgi:uncharacterized protein (TIGR02145 family)